MAHPAQPSAPVLRVLLALAQLVAARGYNEWTLVAAVDRNRWCAPPARDPLSTHGAAAHFQPPSRAQVGLRGGDGGGRR